MRLDDRNGRFTRKGEILCQRETKRLLDSWHKMLLYFETYNESDPSFIARGAKRSLRWWIHTTDVEIFKQSPFSSEKST